MKRAQKIGAAARAAPILFDLVELVGQEAVATGCGVSASAGRPDRARDPQAWFPSCRSCRRSSSLSSMFGSGRVLLRFRLGLLLSSVAGRRFSTWASKRLDLLKLRSRDDVLLSVRQHGFDVLFRRFNAIAGRRMRAEHLGDASRLCAFLRLQLFEETHRRARIVSGLVEILHAQVVRFALSLTRELEKLHRNQESCSLAETETSNAAHKDQRNRSNVNQLRLSTRSRCRGALPREQFRAP